MPTLSPSQQTIDRVIFNVLRQININVDKETYLYNYTIKLTQMFYVCFGGQLNDIELSFIPRQGHC